MYPPDNTVQLRILLEFGISQCFCLQTIISHFRLRNNDLRERKHWHIRNPHQIWSRTKLVLWKLGRWPKMLQNRKNGRWKKDVLEKSRFSSIFFNYQSFTQNFTRTPNIAIFLSRPVFSPSAPLPVTKKWFEDKIIGFFGILVKFGANFYHRFNRDCFGRWWNLGVL